MYRSKKPSIYDEYFNIQRQHEALYGSRTVVLMQIGKFYEIYEYDPELDESESNNQDNFIDPYKPTKRIGYATEVGSDMDWNVHKCRKLKPHSPSNPLTVGCPIGSYSKENRKNLLQHNWTIIRVDQRPIGNNKVERFVAEIASPGTEIIDGSEKLKLTNYIVSIYIDVQNHSKRLMNYNLICGVSSIDLTTGENYISEFYSQDKDPEYAIKEIYRYLLSKRPVEVIINLRDIPSTKQEKYSIYLEKALKLDNYPITAFRYDEFPKDFFKLDYQKAQLSKVFNNKFTDNQNLVFRNNIINDLNLERMSYGRLSYILLLNYVYEHNDQALNKISRPKVSWLDEKDTLILTHNAIVQSNIYPENKMFHPYNPIKTSKKATSLFEIIDQTSTKMGQRRLQRLLYNPLTDPKQLENSYNMVEEALNNNLWKKLEDSLKGMVDLDLLQRTLVLKTIQPRDLSRLFKSYIKIIEIYSIISKTSDISYMKYLLPDELSIKSFNTAIQKVWTSFDIDKLKDCKLEGGMISGGISFIDYPLLTDLELYNQSLQIKNYLVTLANYLNESAKKQGKSRGKEIEFRDDVGGRRVEGGGVVNTAMGFITSKTNAKNLQKAIDSGQVDLQTWGNIEFNNIKDGTLITSPMIRQQCINYDNCKNELMQKLWDTYKETVNYLSETFDFYATMSSFISRVDIIKSYAKSAIKYKYFRPEIDDETTNSYIEATDLRHPLVERIHDEEYIPNNISLGKNPQGILLYGANQAGKSTLAKSIGLAVIMAQIGGFTAGHVKLRPYHKIITRLTGNDNLIEGKSSFVVELSEVLTIERNMDAHTLVLGDELCRGTESASGTSITITMVEFLIQHLSSFIFSTHMHHLVDMQEIKTIPPEKLKICHLQIYYDENLDTLIYNRKLQDGPGPSIYGLETAKYLGFSKRFIERAMAIRRDFLNESQQLLNTKKSKYNSRVYIDHCAICKSSDIDKLEVHHIKEQKDADDLGFIDTVPKNAIYNLIVLCYDCHHNLIHGQNNKIQIDQSPGAQIVRVIPSCNNNEENKVQTSSL